MCVVEEAGGTRWRAKDGPGLGLGWGEAGMRVPGPGGEGRGLTWRALAGRRRVHRVWGGGFIARKKKRGGGREARAGQGGTRVSTERDGGRGEEGMAGRRAQDSVSPTSNRGTPCPYPWCVGMLVVTGCKGSAVGAFAG